MDFHADYSVILTTDIEHNSLYKWCLQEFDADGEQVGSDLIPWAWSLKFSVSNLRYSFNLSGEDGSGFSLLDGDDALDDEEEKETERDINFKNSEVIVADLTPTVSGSYKAAYSMLGTNRNIKDIQLLIKRSEKDSCDLWGCVRYTYKIDFRNETTDDTIQIYLYLTPEKFDEISGLINSRIVNVASLRLSGVFGFYSNWSPEISTDSIKVLTPLLKDHNLEIPEDCQFDPPRLGRVDEFDLQLGNNLPLLSDDADEVERADYDWADEKAASAVASISEYYQDQEDHFSEDADEAERDDSEGISASTVSTSVEKPSKRVCRQSRNRSGNLSILARASTVG